MPATISRLIPPTEWRKRQLDTLKAVGQRNYESGIDMPKKDPIKEGIAAEDRWATRIKEAIDKGRRKAKLAKVTMDEWNAYAHAFAGKLVDGVVKREAKVAEFIDAWQPKLASHLSKIDAMPAVTDADMENRMLENLRGLKAMKGTW
jgi:hypothetical protein